MGTDTKGYIFKKIAMKNFIEGLSTIPNLEVGGNSLETSTVGDKKTISGFVYITYKNVNRSLFVFMRESEDYSNRLSSFDNFDNVRGYIPNFGETQIILNLSLGLDNDGLSIDIIGNILKVFGGVLMPNDCNYERGIKYIKGQLDNNLLFENVRTLPNVILNQFVSDYLSSSDLTSINSKLKVKTRGLDLLKEFAYRNLNSI